MVDIQDDSYNYLEHAELAVLLGDIPKAKLNFTRFAKLNAPFPEFLRAQTHCSWAECFSAEYKYPEAILKYRKALQINPKLFKAYNGWGVCLSKMGRYDDAIQIFKKAIEISDKNPVVVINVVLVLLLKGNEKEALESFTVATKKTSKIMLRSVISGFQDECQKLEKRVAEIENQDERVLVQERRKGIERLLNLLLEKQKA